MEVKADRSTGMVGFTIIWLGQIVSLLGTAMSQFGLTLWAYEVTGKATPLALVGFFFITPQVLLSPFIGVLVDRRNRRLMMMLSDLAAAFTTVVILILYTTSSLQIWHLYVTATIAGVFQGFQWPAYSAAISLMLPKKQYARANGMLATAGNASAVLAPLLAGALIVPLGLAGILVIDLVAAAVAVGTLLLVRIPQPPRSEAGREGAGSFLGEAAYGFRHIAAQPSLLGLLTIFMVVNFFTGLAFAVLAPMILARTDNNELIFGTVQSVGAIGGVAGGLIMSAWGGPMRRIHGVLLGMFCSGLLGQSVMGLGLGLPVWVAGMSVMALTGPITNGCSQAIWQAKVAPDVQGRVFASRLFVAWLVSPLSRLVAGPLADRVLEPAMAEGGRLVPAFGWLVGTGPGAGIGLIFVLGGLLVSLTALSGYLIPAVHHVEEILPDHDAVPTVAEALRP